VSEGACETGGWSFFIEETGAKAPMGAPHATIIFTHLGRLREDLGSGFPGFEALLRRYVSERSPEGGRRVLLDAGRNFLGECSGAEWQGHLRILRAAVDWMEDRALCAESVLIVGDERVIPMPCLENPVGADSDVDSDYPYSALSEADPWEELHPERVAVGRIPVGTASGAGPGTKYLENVLRAQGGIAAAEPFGLGAAVWAGASRETLATFSRAPVVLSPPSCVRVVEERLGSHQGLLYFNLHGTNEPDEPGWFGESHQREFPKVVVPRHFKELADFNVVGVEACYGGRFTGYAEDGSCLLSALGHRTLGFLGASRIAFGPPDPPRGLADIVVGDFLRHVSGGASLGRAHMEARRALEDAAEEDAHARLSILEFNLFGDPDLCPFPGSGVSLGKAPGSDDGQGGVSGMRGRGTPASRLRGLIRAETQSARKKIGAAIRKVDLGALIGAEIRRSLDRCREASGDYLAQRCPSVLGGEVREACYGSGGRMLLLQHFFKKARGGPRAGISLKQDLASGQILQAYHIK
jgi:hypothetical protein